MAQFRLVLTLPGFGGTKTVYRDPPPAPAPPPNPPPTRAPVQANAARDASLGAQPANISNPKRGVGMAAGSYGGGIVRNAGGARGVSTSTTQTAARALMPSRPRQDVTGGLTQSALKSLTGM